MLQQDFFPPANSLRFFRQSNCQLAPPPSLESAPTQFPASRTPPQIPPHPQPRRHQSPPATICGRLRPASAPAPAIPLYADFSPPPHHQTNAACSPPPAQSRAARSFPPPATPSVKKPHVRSKISPAPRSPAPHAEAHPRHTQRNTLPPKTSPKYAFVSFPGHLGLTFPPAFPQPFSM